MAATGGGFKHLVIVKFKDGVNEDEILNGLQKMVSEIQYVKSFEWGKDTESHDGLRQGHTHAFLTTFDSKEDYNSFVSHPSHVQFSATFSDAIEKIVLLDFPSSLLLLNPSPPAP